MAKPTPLHDLSQSQHMHASNINIYMCVCVCLLFVKAMVLMDPFRSPPLPRDDSIEILCRPHFALGSVVRMPDRALSDLISSSDRVWGRRLSSLISWSLRGTISV